MLRFLVLYATVVPCVISVLLLNLNEDCITLVAVGVPAVLEPNGLTRDDGKRPDGMSLFPWKLGRPLVWDATCVDTLAPCHLPSTSCCAGAAATAAENLKRRKYTNLVGGAKCKRGDFEGECVCAYKCLGSLLDAVNKDNAPLCSFQGKDPIICCTDCDRVDDTRNYIWNENLGFLRKTGNKAEDKCLEYMHTLDYPCKSHVYAKRNLNVERKCYEVESESEFSSGGIPSLRNEFPHMALLGYGDSSETADWLCGGTVISERFILTAGHCISSPVLGTVKFVSVGILKRSDPIDLWDIYKVKNIVSHPGYKPPSKYNDIALLETETPIVFKESVRPACLHTEGEADHQASATGWGALGHRAGLADVLQAVYLSRFEDEDCSKKYPAHRHLKYGYDNTTQMCYGDFVRLRDTCEGDSGGPLQSSRPPWCVFTVLGVTSYGIQCGIGPGSGIYTRVKHYVPWIENIVWP